MLPEDVQVEAHQVRRAQKLQRPFDSSFQVQDHTSGAMFQVLTKGTEAIHEERIQKVRWMKLRVI